MYQTIILCIQVVEGYFVNCMTMIGALIGLENLRRIIHPTMKVTLRLHLQPPKGHWNLEKTIISTLNILDTSYLRGMGRTPFISDVMTCADFI